MIRFHRLKNTYIERILGNVKRRHFTLVRVKPLCLCWITLSFEVTFLKRVNTPFLSEDHLLQWKTFVQNVRRISYEVDLSTERLIFSNSSE